jgi:hypothetical protein
MLNMLRWITVLLEHALWISFENWIAYPLTFAYMFGPQNKSSLLYGFKQMHRL